MTDGGFPRGPDGRSTDLVSGLGVPRWIAASLNYCSRCGSPLHLGPVDGEDRDRLACANCGLIAYVNPRLVVTTFPITDAGEIVLIRRGIEPGRGSWAQPGGFLEVDETVNHPVGPLRLDPAPAPGPDAAVARGRRLTPRQSAAKSASVSPSACPAGHWTSSIR